jgi:voltage-gated potassium channel
VSSPDQTNQERDARRKAAVARRIYPILAGAVLFVLAVGTVAYHYLEDWSWVDAFYFSSVAGSTVGFGDLSPTTNGSKLFTVVYIFSSMTIIATFLDQRLKYHGIVIRQAKREGQDSTDNGGGANP